ncbi:MAG: RluA family pseudouridine synthase [Gloeomargarita sp. SKYG116]|nr:RluA family pseudouridine synthase [Gloeomargarita sp. SKYG116]MDW8401366.1 RluA family pseudouridine synthase [Gloeomargarita sp. SKYGB_i_bin116]
MEVREFRVVTPIARLDQGLAQQWSDLSRSRIQKLIQQGQVWVNQRVQTDKNHPLRPGDWVQMHIPPPAPLETPAQPLPLDILYEDDHLLILNKPAGLVVHPAPGHWDQTLVNALLAHCPHFGEMADKQRPGIVHRLDKDTTGVMVVAKTAAALQHLQRQIQARQMQREYLGLIHGRLPTPTGTVTAPIGRHPRHRRKMAVVPTGRPAVTHWQVLATQGDYSWVHFRLETGRTHQIRVHMSHLGHPLVNDPLYSANRRYSRYLPGQALHAWRLGLHHPHTGERLTITAPLPESLGQLLHQLGFTHNPTMAMGVPLVPPANQDSPRQQSPF